MISLARMPPRPEQRQQQPAAAARQLDPLFHDVTALLLEFLLRVEQGQPPSLATFKQAWQDMHFSLVFEVSLSPARAPPAARGAFVAARTPPPHHHTHTHLAATADSLAVRSPLPRHRVCRPLPTRRPASPGPAALSTCSSSTA